MSFCIIALFLPFTSFTFLLLHFFFSYFIIPCLAKFTSGNLYMKIKICSRGRLCWFSSATRLLFLPRLLKPSDSWYPPDWTTQLKCNQRQVGRIWPGREGRHLSPLPASWALCPFPSCLPVPGQAVAWTSGLECWAQKTFNGLCSLRCPSWWPGN